jgi:plastocyanin
MRALTARFVLYVAALLAAVCVFPAAIASWAQKGGAVAVQVEITKRGATQQPAATSSADQSNVVIWLSSLDHAVEPFSNDKQGGAPPQVVQRNKAFEPHLLVVQAGTMVQFPNKDPFFHNVFSLFNGKRFDLGFYEAGSSKSVRFDRPGVSFLFCNIHEEMSAAIVAVDTPYFGSSDRSGHVVIPNVPDGHYEMHAWYERSTAEDLKSLDRAVTISGSARTLDVVRVAENPNFTLAHKNKYGAEYVPPSSLGYSH